MKIRFEHDPDCPLGENGLRAYWEAREALASTPPEARTTQADEEALAMAEFELEHKQRCNCGLDPYNDHDPSCGCQQCRAIYYFRNV